MGPGKVRGLISFALLVLAPKQIILGLLDAKRANKIAWDMFDG